MTLPHIIRQQHFKVRVNANEAAGFELQRMLPGLNRDLIMPAIERAFERCSTPHEHLYIGRLDINVGPIALDRLEADLAESIARALEKSLKQFTAQADGFDNPDNDNVRLITAQQSSSEALAYFLTTGRLPWSFRLPVGQSFEQMLLDSWRSSGNATVNAGLISSVLKNATPLDRLVKQFSNTFLEDLLRQLSPDIKKTIDEVFAAPVGFKGSSVEKNTLTRHLWKRALTALVNAKPISAKLLVRETLETLPNNPAWYIWADANWPDRAKPELAKPNRLDLAKTSAAVCPPLLQGENLGGDIKILPLQTPDLAPPYVAIITSLTVDENEKRAGLYLDCAGLVLLHPFLPQFFNALGIADDGALTQPGKALSLLHFLATGQTIAPEYALILPKILCNLPLEYPAESDVPLTTAEHEEANAVLEAVIRHWQALRNTSVDGLRGTFLIRPGKITLQNDGGWLLQVEPQTCDILLDQLPWGIGMIKLPWMGQILRVEWNN